MAQAQAAVLKHTASRGLRLDLDRVPGPSPTRFLGAYGNMYRIWTDTVSYLDMLVDGGYGPVVSFARGMQRGLFRPAHESPGALFAYGSELIECTLHKSVDANFAETVVGNFPEQWTSAARLNKSLLWMQGEPHRQRRKVVAPLYHQREVQRYRDCLAAVIGNALDSFVVGEPIALMEQAGRVLVSFQQQAILGSAGLAADIANVGLQISQLLQGMFNPLAHFGPDMPHSPRRKMKEAASGVADNLAALVAAKRAGHGHNDVVKSLIHARSEDGSALSDNDIVAELFGLFLGGWFSSRTSLAWTMLLLAQHPSVARDLHDELTSLLHGDPPTVDQLRALPLLDGVIKESLRLLPPFPLLTRFTTNEVELAGYRVPKHTEVWLGILHTHRDPDVFTDPKRFRPERWSSLSPSPYEYLPFGVGTRTCPGMALANLQMKIFVSMLVQRYRLEVTPGTKVSYSGLGMAMPRPDVRMIVRKQDREFGRSSGRLSGNIDRMVDMEGRARA